MLQSCTTPAHVLEALSMISAHQIPEHAPIVGSDGVHVAAVDRVEGDRIKLTKANEDGNVDDRPHHFIPLSLVDCVENGIVWLRSKAAEVVSFEEGSTTYNAR